MKNPIKIKLFKECIPKKGIWYNHLGTIFISVMRKSNPYIRRKSITKDNKRDNELSEWHRVWQYDRIESKYGVEKYGEKSYERTIKVDGENHRIDSIVENIAIEFQHTLSVEIEEMNSRFKAHSKFGFQPYLVIDLTKYKLDSFDILKYQPIYLKWAKCEYALSNNLFLDLKDGMVRVINTIKNITHKIEKHFLENLLHLEDDLLLLMKKEETKEKWKSRKQEVQKKIGLEKEEKSRQEKLANEKNIYNDKKRNSHEFKYYRKCLASKVIRPYIKHYDKIVFAYHSSSETKAHKMYMTHLYKSNTNISIKYTTVTEISKIETPTSRGAEIRKRNKYLHSTIKITDNNTTVIEFQWVKGQGIKKIDKNEYLLF